MASRTTRGSLEPGDHLTREEFERRYEAMPYIRKAELIEGVVYMPSPVSPAHGRSDSLMIVWMGYYAAFTPGCEVLNNTSWAITAKSLPQPDAALHILAQYGGGARDQSHAVLLSRRRLRFGPLGCRRSRRPTDRRRCVSG